MGGGESILDIHESNWVVDRFTATRDNTLSENSTPPYYTGTKYYIGQRYDNYYKESIDKSGKYEYTVKLQIIDRYTHIDIRRIRDGTSYNVGTSPMDMGVTSNYSLSVVVTLRYYIHDGSIWLEYNDGTLNKTQKLVSTLLEDADYYLDYYTGSGNNNHNVISIKKRKITEE